ncbi:MAG: hypothetical protein K2H64_11125 [Desulfovibrio sp.]|nr:hypothetical protein [Desulfovibrio sp.]
MNGWQAVFAEYPALRTVWDIVCVVAPLSMLLSFSGIFFISSVAKIFSITRKRIIFDKLAKQLAFLGIILGWILLVGSRATLYLGKEGLNAAPLENFMFETSWMLLSMGVLLSTIYFSLWKVLKNMPVFHTTIGVISATQNCLSLVCILATLRLYAFPAKTGSVEVLIPDLFPAVWDDPLWTAACVTASLAFGLAGAFGSAWLCLRRKREDFGRDYYNRMIPWCAAWARNAWLLLLLILLFSFARELWLNHESAALDPRSLILAACQILFWLIPALLWTFVHRSKVAVRHRWALYIALIIAISYALPYYLEICALPPLDILPVATESNPAR